MSAEDQLRTSSPSAWELAPGRGRGTASWPQKPAIRPLPSRWTAWSRTRRRPVLGRTWIPTSIECLQSWTPVAQDRSPCAPIAMPGWWLPVPRTDPPAPSIDSCSVTRSYRPTATLGGTGSTTTTGTEPRLGRGGRRHGGSRGPEGPEAATASSPRSSSAFASETASIESRDEHSSTHPGGQQHHSTNSTSVYAPTPSGRSTNWPLLMPCTTKPRTTSSPSSPTTLAESKAQTSC